MEKNLYDIGLPKWPALVVVGNQVTEEQAMEILIRTDNFYFGCNDHEWEAEIHNIVYGVRSRDVDNHLKEKYGFERDKYSSEFWALKESFQQRYAPIELSYLTNSRIASAWIGGAHGWCSWDGKIGCSNYNIGKWPSVEEVHNDWIAIASEFPFLDLKCQLMNEEADESETIKPLIEFKIKDGKAEMYEPGEILAIPAFGDEDMWKRFNDPHGERGCSLETVTKAFNFVEEKFKILNNIEKGKFWKKIQNK